VKKGGFRPPISCYLFRTTSSENNASRAEAALKNPLSQPPLSPPPPPAGSMVIARTAQAFLPLNGFGFGRKGEGK
jgi:hypothetical protein